MRKFKMKDFVISNKNWTDSNIIRKIKFASIVIFLLLINFFSLTFDGIYLLRNVSFCSLALRKIRGPQTKRDQLVVYFKELGLTENDVDEIIETFPQVLGYSLEDNIKPKVEYFVTELSLSKKDIGEIIKTHPQVLGYSLEDNIKPKVELLKRMGVAQEKLTEEFLKIATINYRVCELIVEIIPGVKDGSMIKNINRRLNDRLKEKYGKTASQLIKEGREDLVREELILMSQH